MRTAKAFAILACGIALAAPASADTLREALALTYLTNPTLEAARADLRAIDENVPLERADGLPGVGANAQYTEFLKKSPNSFTAPDRALVTGVELTVPIYQGGAVRNGIRAAKERVDAGRADLRATESSVFAQVVAAYMDVILDQEVVRLSGANVGTLRVNLEATSDRFEIGDLTRTDVAQSGSRLALARSDLLSAEANLIGSRERYVQLVGKPPVDLQPPPPLPNLPDDPDLAVAIALENNPDLIAAREFADAAFYDIEVAGAARLPRVEVFTGSAYNDFFGTLGGPGGAAGGFSQSETTAQAGARLTVPLYQGGRPAALERQAQARAAALLERAVAVERDIIAQTRAAFSSWLAAREVIVATETAVDAASLSLEGVRAENTVGNRTILDILDAERELLSAQVQLVTARRNAYVAGFSLLAAMGRAEAEDLGLEVGPLYDPVVNYRRVSGKWWDLSFDPDPQAQATRTVDTPAQDATIPPP